MQLCSLLSSLSFIVRNLYCNVDMAIWEKVALQVVTSNYSDVYMMDQSLYTDLNFRHPFFFELFYIDIYFLLPEGQAWCSGESCLTESPGRGFEAASSQILRGGGLP